MRIAGALIAAASLLALTGGIDAQAPQAGIQPQVDKLFARWTTSTPGCAVGADVAGKPVVRSVYGTADLEHDVPITLDTVFEVGSVSKQFTAAAVLLLARDGKLSLEDVVRKYIPEMPDVAANVTIRQMLNHTAGLRDWGGLAAIQGWPRTTRVHTHAHVLDLVSHQRMLNFEPGTRWSYSNTGYNLAAILVGRVSGMSFPDFTRTRIFEPLGMTSTSWRDDYTRVVKRRAMAYDEQKGVFSTLMPFENVYGNGGLLTTVGDLLKWNANFARPVVGDARFVEEMQRRTKFNDGREHEYALGLYVDTYAGHREVDHSGGTAGYVAHLSRYPNDQVFDRGRCVTSEPERRQRERESHRRPADAAYGELPVRTSQGCSIPTKARASRGCIARSSRRVCSRFRNRKEHSSRRTPGRLTAVQHCGSRRAETSSTSSMDAAACASPMSSVCQTRTSGSHRGSPGSRISSRSSAAI